MTTPRPTVLLVADEPHSLSAMRMALEDEFDCITAGDAETRNGARLFQLARDNERLALEMRFLACSAQSKRDKRRGALRDWLGFETILRSPQSPMSATVEAARHYASFDIPVLLTGEPGTGRSRLARAMHIGSLRSDGLFHTLSIAGLPDDLAAIELFGAKRGVLPGGVNR